MRRPGLSLLFAAHLCASILISSSADAQTVEEYNPGQLLVGIMPRQAASPRLTQLQTSDLLARLHKSVDPNIKVVRSFFNIGWQLVQLPANLTPQAAMTSYKEAFTRLRSELGSRLTPNSFEGSQLANSTLAAEVNGYVKILEPVAKGPARAETISPGVASRATAQAITPNDALYSQQGRYGVIHAPDAWSLTQGDRNVIVAIVDGGIDYRHPDLRDNMWPAHGYNPCTGGNDFPPDDHATHVAGIIGETGNNGAYGVGVNWRVTLVSLPELTCSASALGGATEPGRITNAQILDAYDWIIQHKQTGTLDIRVVNNSWINVPSGQAYDSQRAAIQSAGDSGILSVFAAGNQGNNNDAQPVYPASYHLPAMISIAASDSANNDQPASFSNYGKQTVDVAAPGVLLLSTCPLTSCNSGMQSMSGTSMASPIVAGAAALLISANRQLTPVQVKQRIMDSVDKLPAWANLVTSGGRINLAKMLQGIPSPGPPPGPTGESFKYSGGTFVKEGAFWVENQDSGGANTFQELFRNAHLVVLWDPIRGLALRLPIAGGMATWTTFDRNDWVNLYNVTHGN